jgi:HPt (histidine-containing phosphotransfer) domain-containing protein
MFKGRANRKKNVFTLFVTTFIEQKDFVENLKSFFEQQNFKDLGSLIHKMITLAGSIDATALSNKCRQVENKIINDNVNIADDLDAIIYEYEYVRKITLEFQVQNAEYFE